MVRLCARGVGVWWPVGSAALKRVVPARSRPLPVRKGRRVLNPVQFESPAFIAIDDSAGPSAGDVYVGDTGDNVVTKFTATGELVKTWGVGGQLDGSTTGGGSFDLLAGVAVDDSGQLDVINGGYEQHQLFEFTQAGGFVRESETPKFNEPEGLAVDAVGDLFNVDVPSKNVEELTGADGDVGEVSNARSATGLAVDGATGDLYIDAGSDVEQYVFEGGFVREGSGAMCALEPEVGCGATGTFGSGVLSEAGGIGVDSATETVYVAEAGGHIDVFVSGISTGTSSARRATAAVLNGTVDPKGTQLTECRFEYVTKAAFEATGFSDLSSGGEAACEPAAASIPADSEEHAVSAEIGGLKEGETYEYRLTDGSATDTNVHANSESLTTSTPPQVVPGSAASANVTASSADLEAQIDPDNGDTTYRIQYGESTAYGASVPLPEADIGEGELALRIAQQVTGLSPNITYHWRVVATNSAGTTDGEDHTFIYDESGPGLPDGRAYEMVTPAQKNGTLIGNYTFAFPPQVSADGSRVVLGAVQCFGGARSCTVTRQSLGTLYSFTRGATGWSATPLAPPATQVETNTYVTASAETGMALFTGPTPPGGEDDFYARRPEGPGASFTDLGPVTPPSAGPNLVSAAGAKVAENAGFSHVVFQLEPVWPFATGEPGHANSLLEYNELDKTAVPQLVGVSGGLGSTDLISACATALTASPPDSNLSTNGRTVYFSAEAKAENPKESCPGTGVNVAKEVPVAELYARVDGGEAGAHTVAISQPRAPQLPVEPPAPCTGGGASCAQERCTSASCQENTSPANEGSAWRQATFQATSSDGSNVLFTSEQQLTDSATEDPSESSCEAGVVDGCNLYLSECFAQCQTLNERRRLIDVSAPEGGATVPGGPRVQGVLAFSSDGSHAYFVARGVLTNAPRAACVAELSAAQRAAEETAKEGRCRAKEDKDNVYVYERDEQHPRGRLAFIATLREELPNHDQLTIGPGQSANVTPNGQFLVFTAADDLTADDTRPDNKEDGAQQVFRYDAAGETLTRVSVGERGFDDNGDAGAGDALIVPGSRGYVSPGAEAPAERRLDPTMSNDGTRVFFSSPVPLTTGALASVPIGFRNFGSEIVYAENVYEWEQAGVGSCPAGQGTGCVYLLSDGRDTSAAQAGEACFPSISSVCLIGSDASGDNVFFTTADPLLPADGDTELDLYDARVCEPENGNPCIQSTPTTTPCLGEACHGTPPATPSLQTPGTASFNGAGNISPPPAMKPKSLTRAQKLANALKSL